MNKVETSGYIHSEKNGIVNVYVKPGQPSIEKIQESIDVLIEYKRQNKNLLILIDPTEGVALNTKQRKYASLKFNEIVNGMAILNKNLFLQFTLKLIFKFDKPHFAIKIYDNKEDAEAWLTELKNKDNIKLN